MILCSDFDSTLKQEDPLIFKENLRAVKNWRNAGNLFVIITRHNHAVLDQILPNWSITSSWIVAAQFFLIKMS